MKALVIYDSTGRIWNIVYGEETAPQGLTCMWVDIPEGAVLERIDVTDAEHPEAVFSYLPESDIGRLQAKVVEQEGEIVCLQVQLTDTQMALCEQYEANLALQEEVTNTQLALCELYEAQAMKEGGEA